MAKKVGRPRYEFSEDQIALAEEMAYNWCQDNTIAVKLDVKVDTLTRVLGKSLRLKRAEAKFALRKRQFEQSEKNPIVGIFLGKNYLGQADKQEISGKDGAPLLAPIINVMAPEPEEKT